MFLSTCGMKLIDLASYSTSSSWVPSVDTKTMPIHVEKMSNTRWGKNWGTYERMDWCQDVDIDTVSFHFVFIIPDLSPCLVL